MPAPCALGHGQSLHPLGKFKSVACVLDVASGEHRFETIVTNSATVHDLLAAFMPDRLVIKACSVVGWVHDLSIALSIPVQVINTNGEAWHYKRVKRKTDRDDAPNETHRVVAKLNGTGSDVLVRELG